MNQRGQQRLTLIPSPSSASNGARSAPRSSALLAVAGLFVLVGSASIGCTDKDTTDVVPVGGSGGTAGSAGAAGRGGSAGTAGTAGTGGAAGTAGSAGTAGTGGTGEVPDAGTDAGDGGVTDAGDAGGPPPPPDPRQVRAEAICQTETDLADCQPAADGCVQGFLDAQAAADGLPPTCSDEILDYYECLATAGTDAFICRDGTGPDTKYDFLSETTPCAAEEAEWFAAQGATSDADCPAD